VPDKRVLDLSALTGANLAGGDVIRAVDISDTTMSAGGTDKRMTVTEFLAGLLGWYNVKHYGAVGNGSNDDRSAIQSALTAANSAGGGTVYCPPGTYRVTVAVHPDSANFFAGLLIGDNVCLVGAGRTSTTIKLANTQTGGSAAGDSAVIMNLAITAGNSRIRVSDLTVDGNNVNQSTAVHQGIDWRHVTDAIVERVTVTNCQGTSTSTYLETGQFYSANCGNLIYRDCWAVGSAGNTASGFHQNGCTNLVLTNCRASGMSVANGFTQFGCYHTVYTGCYSYKNTVEGFNCESSVDVSYVGCVAGGDATTDSKGFTASQNLGNTVDGFAVTTSTVNASFVGCQSRHNGNIGFNFSGSDAVASGCEAVANVYGFAFQSSARSRISACMAKSNTNGVYIDNATTLGLTRIQNMLFLSNTNDFNIPAGSVTGGPGPASVQPAVPASTTALATPYPVDATVHVAGGTVTVVSVGGTATGLVTPCTVRVCAGSTITLTYTVAPTWKWFID